MVYKRLDPISDYNEWCDNHPTKELYDDAWDNELLDELADNNNNGSNKARTGRVELDAGTKDKAASGARCTVGGKTKGGK